MKSFDKIKGYSFGQLFRIVFFKTVLKTALLYEKTKNRLFGTHWQSLQPKEKPFLDLRPYLENCNKDTEGVVAVANQVLSGKISIFHHQFNFDSGNDWLKDPISEKQWDAKVFAHDASVKQEGFGDVKFVLEINKFNFLVQVAQAYYLTKDEKYIKYIDSSFKGWIDKVNPEQSVVNKIIMDLGFRVINIVQIIFLCQDNAYFTSNTLPVLLGIVKQHEKTIRKFSSPRWLKTGNGGNHNIGEMVGLLCAQWVLVSYGCGSCNKSQKDAYRYLMEALDRTIASNGLYLENSTNYARLVYEFLVFFDIIRQVFSVSSKNDNEYETKNYKERLANYLSDITYHNQLPNFGDNDDAQVLIPFKQDSCDIPFIAEKTKTTRGDYLDSGQWLYRSKDKNDVYLFTRVGRFSSFREGANIHVHNDILSIVLGVKGNFVFIDRGCFLYNSGEQLLKEYKSIVSHNTIVVDGVEQSDIQGWAMKNYPISKHYTNERHDNSCSFDGEVRYKSIIHKRKVDYDGEAIIIKDVVSEKNNKSVRGYVQYLLAPEITCQHQENNVLELFIGANPVAMISIDGVDNLVVEDTTYSPSYACEQPTKIIKGFFSENVNKEIKTLIQL